MTRHPTPEQSTQPITEHAISIKHLRKRGILEIRLDREEVLNALDIPHLESLIETVREGMAHADTRCMVLAGEGRAFCVGADIKAMDTMSEKDFAYAASLYQDLSRTMRTCPVPIIAAINGYALGGGLELALMADIRLAGKSARLGLPDAELGFSPTGGLTYLLNHVAGAGWVLHLALTAEMLSAEKALQIGLVTRLVDDGKLHGQAMQMAETIAGYPPAGIRHIKQSFNHALQSSFESSLELEAVCDSECFSSPETRLALKRFLRSRGKS